jgi:Protein of unknown function (DUF3179)
MKKLLLALTVLNLALVIAALVVLLPFITQTPAMLAIARAAKTFSPMVSVASAAFAIAVVWRLRSWASLALILACAVLSRVNYVEWIFAPATETQTAEIGRFHDVADSDMVIGVSIAGKSRAYPVRYLAHHHMLNDRLGATALLPTY